MIVECAQCGKCQRLFFLVFEDDSTVTCPYCQTIYKQRDNQWVCEYHVILNPNPIEIPLNDIIIQQKVRLKDVSLRLLIGSIKEEGLLHPIVVRKKDAKKYVLIDGLQRYLAVKSLGWKSIPCLILPEPEKL